MLLYQTNGYWLPPKIYILKLRISTLRGWLADVAHQTLVHSDRLDVGSETGLRIKVKELLCDDAYLSKIIDDKKSWSTRMEVLDPI